MHTLLHTQTPLSDQSFDLAECCTPLLRRDLKLENILLTANGQVKLSDFGLGAVKEAAAQHEMLHTVHSYSFRLELR